MRRDTDRLDHLIDDALRAYSSPEPLDGLEQRIIRRVAVASRAPARGSLLPFSIAAAALAAVVLSAILLRSWREPPAETGELAARHLAGTALAPPKPASEQGASRMPAQPVRNQRSRGVELRRATSGRPTNPRPQMERFPSPAPITAGERALAVWAAAAPLEVRDAMADPQKQASEPILIKPIEIDP